MADAVRVESVLHVVRAAIRALEERAPGDPLRTVAIAVAAEALPIPRGDPLRLKLDNATVLIATTARSREAQLVTLRAIEAALDS